MHRSVRPPIAGAHPRVTRDRVTRLDSQAWVCVFGQPKQGSNLGSGKPTARDSAGTLAMVAVSVRCLETVGIPTRERLEPAQSPYGHLPS